MMKYGRALNNNLSINSIWPPSPIHKNTYSHWPKQQRMVTFHHTNIFRRDNKIRVRIYALSQQCEEIGEILSGERLEIRRFKIITIIIIKEKKLLSTIGEVSKAPITTTTTTIKVRACLLSKISIFK